MVLLSEGLESRLLTPDGREEKWTPIMGVKKGTDNGERDKRVRVGAKRLGNCEGREHALHRTWR